MTAAPPPGPGEETGAARRVCVARITGAHGVRGEVRLHVFAEAPEALRALGPFEDAAGTRTFALDTLRRQGEGFVARLAGVADRDTAEALRGTDLYVPRARLPAIGEDETYYHADLIGLAVETPEGEPVGTVAEVLNFGAGDILDVARPGGGTFMVPFTKAMVPEVDLAAGRLRLANAELAAAPAPRRPRSKPR